MQYYRDLELPGVEFVRIAVGSEGDVSRLNAEMSGWEYVEADNSPLSDKMNVASLAFKGRGCDAIIILGSDDFLNRAGFDALIQKYRDGWDSIGFEDIYYYDLNRDKFFTCTRCAAGAGHMVSATLAEQLGYNLWPSGIERRLDGQQRNYFIEKARPIRSTWIKDCFDQGIALVDVKTDVSMWSVEDMELMIGRVNSEPVDTLDELFPGLRGMLSLINQPVEER